jgi:hypothetical protein
MKFRHAAALALVVLFGACTTQKSVMASWVGQPESHLLASWGAPDRTAVLADGGKVDTWVTTWNDNYYGLHTCRKTFTLDAEGKVVKWAYSDCGLF